MKPRLCYLDNNATTRTAPEALEAMLPFFCERYGNASSMHEFGGTVRADVDAARERIAAFLGAASPSEIVFTSCGSESDNQAIFGTVEALGPETVVITSQVEHPAVLQPCLKLEERGYRVLRVGVNPNGTLRMDEYSAALATPGPKLVTLMWANNETGVLFPIAECARMAKAAGAVFHTDATQAAGKVPIDLSALPVDLLTFSGHKLHAPKGIGVLYIRHGTPIRPFLLGGHQEESRRAGTENVPYIVSVIMLRMALTIPEVISSEVFITYIGLGLPPSTPSLGNLVNAGRVLMMSPELRYQLIFPTVVLSIITVSFYVVGNAFSDSSDPRNHH